jgi:hypothetical protein
MSGPFESLRQSVLPTSSGGELCSPSCFNDTTSCVTPTSADQGSDYPSRAEELRSWRFEAEFACFCESLLVRVESPREINDTPMFVTLIATRGSGTKKIPASSPGEVQQVAILGVVEDCSWCVTSYVDSDPGFIL